MWGAPPPPMAYGYGGYPYGGYGGYPYGGWGGPYGWGGPWGGYPGYGYGPWGGDYGYGGYGRDRGGFPRHHAVCYPLA